MPASREVTELALREFEEVFYAKQWTQVFVAKQTQVSRQYIHRVLTRKQKPSEKVLIRLLLLSKKYQ